MEVEKAAAKSGAPFLAAAFPLVEARKRWAHVFALVSHLCALEKAVDAAKRTLETPQDMQVMNQLKAERDALRRTFSSLEFWDPPKA